VHAPNILLLINDSARRDRCACYGYGRATTPALDALAGEGVRFDAAYSESSWTVPVMFTLLTGLAPREHQGERLRRLPAALPTLPELLKKRGYHTFAASANPFFGPKCGVERGFDEFRRPPRAIRIAKPFVKYMAQRLGWADNGGRAIADGFARALPAVRRPWFGVLWFFDTHTPYGPKRPFIDRFARERLPFGPRNRLLARLRRPPELAATATAEELRQLSDLYDAAIAYADMLIGEVCDALRQRGLWDDTVVIVAADHGEMLGERGLAGHGRSGGMYQPVVHVPLIARGPGFPSGATSAALVQWADVTQTVAELAGAAPELPATAAQRVSLLQAARGAGRDRVLAECEPFNERSAKAFQRRNPSFEVRPHLCHLAMAVQDGWKLIHRSPGREELYDLAHDSAETRDLSADEPNRAHALREVVARWQGEAHPHPAVASIAEDDEAIVERRLQDLGYF